MRNLQNTKSKILFFTICLTIGFPMGILMIIFGFIHSISYISIPGILFTVLGFYGTPLLWISYKNYCYYNSLVQQITMDKILNISLLSKMNGKSISSTSSNIQWLIVHRYLVGYVIIDNEFLVKKNKETNLEKTIAQKTGKLTTIRCPHCSALVELINGNGICTYCNSTICNSTIHQNK